MCTVALHNDKGTMPASSSSTPSASASAAAAAAPNAAAPASKDYASPTSVTNDHRGAEDDVETAPLRAADADADADADANGMSAPTTHKHDGGRDDDDDDDGDFPYASGHPRRSPMSIGRGCIGFFVFPMTVVLVAMTYWPMVSVYGSSWVMMVLFHLLLAGSLKSYWGIISIDAGTVPDEWNDAVNASPPPTRVFPRCRHTKKFIPLRAHYDEVTGRVVLNFDHFCPWVWSSIGFFNRKYFVLFCMYTCALSLFSALALLPWTIAATSSATVSSSTLYATASSSTPASDPGNLRVAPDPNADADAAAARLNAALLLNRGVLMLATVLDFTFAATLALFSAGHLWMAAKNQTSIEHAKESSRFDCGWRENFLSLIHI